MTIRQLYIDKSKDNIGSKELKPYKGYRIEKSWEFDRNNRCYGILYIGYYIDNTGLYHILAGETLSMVKDKIDGKIDSYH